MRNARVTAFEVGQDAPLEPILRAAGPGVLLSWGVAFLFEVDDIRVKSASSLRYILRPGDLHIRAPA